MLINQSINHSINETLDLEGIINILQGDNIIINVCTIPCKTVFLGKHHCFEWLGGSVFYTSDNLEVQILEMSEVF